VTAIEVIRAMMESNRSLLLMLLKDLDGAALMYRPGGQGNNALWLLGHIASGEDHLASFGGAKIKVAPVGDLSKFAMGSTPVADASAYPTKQQLLDYAAAVHEQVLAALAKTKDADLDQPAVNAPEFFKSRGHAWQMVVSHETGHIGQLTVIRRELGFAPIY
jgi:uncharacterized damage-inducible protein DinB